MPLLPVRHPGPAPAPCGPGWSLPPGPGPSWGAGRGRRRGVGGGGWACGPGTHPCAQGRARTGGPQSPTFRAAHGRCRACPCRSVSCRMTGKSRPHGYSLLWRPVTGRVTSSRMGRARGGPQVGVEAPWGLPGHCPCRVLRGWGVSAPSRPAAGSRGTGQGDDWARPLLPTAPEGRLLAVPRACLPSPRPVVPASPPAPGPGLMLGCSLHPQPWPRAPREACRHSTGFQGSVSQAPSLTTGPHCLQGWRGLAALSASSSRTPPLGPAPATSYGPLSGASLHPQGAGWGTTQAGST